MHLTITPFAARAATAAPQIQQPKSAVCPLCDGQKVVPIPIELWPRGVISPVESCPCVKAADLNDLLDRSCAGLSRVEPVPESPLVHATGMNLIVRSPMTLAQRHLSRVIRDNQSVGMVRTVTDQDLVDAQFSMSRKDADLPSELFLPPELLVLQLGCTAGKHKYLPSVIGQAVARRAQRGRTTWIVDARALDPSHPAWSDQLLGIFSAADAWGSVDLDPQPAVPAADPAPAAPQFPPVQAAAAAPQVTQTPQVPQSDVEIDPGIRDLAMRNGWTWTPQSNGGVRIPCPKHPGSGYDLSIWRVKSGVLKGKLRYKCQLESCAASGDPAALKPAKNLPS